MTFLSLSMPPSARLLFVSSLTYRSCTVMIGVMFVFMIMLMDRIE